MGFPINRTGNSLSKVKDWAALIKCLIMIRPLPFDFLLFYVKVIRGDFISEQISLLT